jgi:class 3 adenylate cyclase/pimeloyl-ACP methyl ester carboxylesterase
LQCPNCRIENRVDARFCRECGAKLEGLCPACSVSVDPDQKFCHACGHRLIETAVAAPGTARALAPEAYTPRHLAERILSSRSAMEGERKQVTVLFADITGSLALIQHRDPEEVHQILDTAISAMMAAVHRYGGTVNKVMGDGIMALFGAPIAHEDHAARGCYAALAMHKAIAANAEQTRQTLGIETNARIGLHSGEVVVRAIRNDLTMDYDAIGQTVHLASRMEQVAPPGSTCLTPDTLRLAEGFVEVAPLGPLPIKGVAEPIDVFRLIGAAPGRTRLQVAATRGLTRFVGRDREMEILRNVLSQCTRGHGQIVAVVGEPGIGKSRLFLEFTQSPELPDWPILETRGVPYGRTSAWLPVVDLLRSYFALDEQDQGYRIAEKVRSKLLALDAALETALPAILSILNVPVADSNWEALAPLPRRRQTLNAIKALLIRQSEIQGLILIVEDIHSIDEETQALLDLLIDSLPTRRMLLLVCYRPEYQHGWGNRAYYTQLRLDFLNQASAEDLLIDLLGHDAGLRRLEQVLIERAKGNPLFLEETVRTLVETGALVGELGAYRPSGEQLQLEIPPTVQAIIAARIDRLASEDKDLLHAAAVVGEVVPLAILLAVADIPEERLHRGLSNLQAAEFLHEARLFPQLEYQFKHGLTHQVTYGSLLQVQRRALHARVAAAMQSLYGDRLSGVAEVIGGHFEGGEVWEEAARCLLLAAEEAKEQYTYPRASGLARRALAAAEKAGGLMPERARAHVLLGDLASLMGDLDGANLAYDDASALEPDQEQRRGITNRRHRPHLVERDGAKIAFYEHGGGEQTIVLVTGLIYGLATLQPIIERLCQEFRILTIDLRGSGASDPIPEGGYNLADHMADVKAVIEAADSRQVVAVGASRGGNLVLKLAIAAPHLIGKLVMVGSALDDMGPQGYTPLPAEFRASIKEALQSRDRERAVRIFLPSVISEPGFEDWIEHAVRTYLRLPPGSLESFFSPDPEVNIINLLGRVDVPTLVMHGTDDQRVPLAVARYLEEHIPNAQLYLFERKGHLPAFTATAEFCEVLRQFARTSTVPHRHSLAERR